jgi:hypothetical protein
MSLLQIDEMQGKCKMSLLQIDEMQGKCKMRNRSL